MSLSNSGYCYRSIIDPQAAGSLLLPHLAQRFDHSTLAEWQSRLEAGEIILDGLPARGDETLRAGQELLWRRPPWEEPPAPLHFAVIHADGDLVLVSKPSGLPTLAGGGFHENSLQSLVQREFPGAHAVHRLGRGTSGLVLFARHSSAARVICSAWSAAGKTYRALAQGVAPTDRCDIQVPIGPQRHPRLGEVFAANAAGKPAHSVARVVERRGESTLFDVELRTGRPHQIRIHLAAIGHPLVGDPLYASGGLPRSVDPGLPGDGGYWLHAHRLSFVHPSHGDRREFVAPPPAILLTEQELSAGGP
jgi:23S rRNA pseudouridine1911/1915/1917 synthase